MRALAPWAAATGPPPPPFAARGAAAGDRLTAVLSARVAAREKKGENEEEKRVRLTCGSLCHTLRIERMNEEAVGVNKKFPLLIEWRVSQIDI